MSTSNKPASLPRELDPEELETLQDLDAVCPPDPAELENPAAEYLRQILAETETSQRALAHAIGIPETRVSELMRGRKELTLDHALRFARYFGGDPQSWINLQGRWLLARRAQELAPDLESIVPAAVST